MLRTLKDIRGQGLVEYVLIILFVAIALVMAFPPIAQAIGNIFTQATP